MNWKTIADTVGKSAPLLGTLLAGPAGGTVGALVASALGVDESQVAAKLADPETAAKLQALQVEQGTRLRELATQVELARLAAYTERQQIAADDRASARRAAVDGGNARRVFWFTVLIFLVVAGIEGAVLLHGMPPGLDPQMVGRVLGTLDAIVLAAMYYTFGSSAGSARKDEVAASK